MSGLVREFYQHRSGKNVHREHKGRGVSAERRAGKRGGGKVPPQIGGREHYEHVPIHVSGGISGGNSMEAGAVRKKKKKKKAGRNKRGVRGRKRKDVSCTTDQGKEPRSGRYAKVLGSGVPKGGHEEG